MKITYIGHACFSIEAENYKVVLDPFKGVEGFEDVELCANKVLCSHEHFDHAYIDGVRIEDGPADPFSLSFIDCFHDECGGKKRGANRITVLEAGGVRAAHLGDLGHTLTAEDAAKLRGVDVLMIPVGGFYTIGPAEAIDVIRAVGPKTVIPMHYKDGSVGLQKIEELDAFLALADDEIKSKLALLRAYGKSIEVKQ